MKAVVAHELNKFDVCEVSLDPPKAGEVLFTQYIGRWRFDLRKTAR